MMKKIDQNEYPNVNFGKNVTIFGESVIICSGAKIGDNVILEAENIKIGHDSVIEYGTVIKGLGSLMTKFIIGDNCLIGFNNQILVPEFLLKDYSQIHNSCLSSGYKPLSIGNNCWIGQNTILNATESLTIGDNVRIGTQSQLWTHVASGELLEGCTLFGFKPLTLEDNVWIVGGAVISPGLVLKRNSIIMTGSVLTKSTEPYNTYAGIPAQNVTDKLNFWKHPSLDDKFVTLRGYLDEFIQLNQEYANLIHSFNNETEAGEKLFNDGNLIFIKEVQNMEATKSLNASIFDLSTKLYTKKRSKCEIDWMKFSIGYRARFIAFSSEKLTISKI